MTVIVKVSAVPSHPLADGVTVIVAIMSVVPLFETAKLGILPVPEAARPIPVLSFTQE